MIVDDHKLYKIWNLSPRHLDEWLLLQLFQLLPADTANLFLIWHHVIYLLAVFCENILLYSCEYQNYHVMIESDNILIKLYKFN